MRKTECSVLIDVDVSTFFEEEGSIELKYCKERATFRHTEACEFILHIGDRKHSASVIKEMKQYGCNQNFINLYINARDLGAMRVLFYA